MNENKTGLSLIQIWRSERVLGRGFCSASIDYDRLNIEEIQPRKIPSRTNSCGEIDAFKEIRAEPGQFNFATMRARMEAASAATSTCASPSNLDESMTVKTTITKNHFDHDEVLRDDSVL